MVDVAHPERAAVVAGEEYLVGIRHPDRRLMCESKCRVRRDSPDGCRRTENLEEVGMKDLEEWRGAIRRVEELFCGGLSEGAVYAEDVEGQRIDQLQDNVDGAAVATHTRRPRNINDM